MRREHVGLVIEILIGVVIGIALAIVALFCFTYRRKRSQIGSSISRSSSSIPIHENGADTTSILSDSSVGIESPCYAVQNGRALWCGRFKNAGVVAAPGILEYSYKDFQTATYNFSSLIGQGAYVHVYKAHVSFGDIIAVKVLATNSKQGEKEFQTEEGLEFGLFKVIFFGIYRSKEIMFRDCC